MLIRKTVTIVLLLVVIAIPAVHVSAIPFGVGVIGDSASQPYQCIGRGNGTTFTWTEILASLRSVNFGGGAPCQAYNKAWSGHTVSQNMTPQTNKVITDYNNGYIGKVISMLGFNDLYSSTTTPNVPALLSTYEANIQSLINAGIAPENILIVDVSQENWGGTTQMLVDQFNAGLLNIATTKQTAFASWESLQAELSCRSRNGGATYNIGGHMVDNTFSNEFHHLRTADGHLGTLGNGLLVDMLIADFLGVPRLTDAEILSMVNASVIPSNPPPACSSLTPIPTVLGPTPTKTNTPVSTFTFTPTNTTGLGTSTPINTWTPTVTSAPGTITIGETNILNTEYSNNGNRLSAQAVTLSQNATLQSLSYYVAIAGGQLRLGVYNNNANNTPGALVAQTASFTPVVGWNTQPVLNQTLLPAGAYWLAFLPESNALTGRMTSAGQAQYYAYTFGSLPTTFSNTSIGSIFRFSFYATLSTSVAGTSTPTNTPLPNNTPTNTSTNTAIPVNTNTPTATRTLTSTVTRTPTPTWTPTNTSTSTATSTTSATIRVGETNILTTTYSGIGNRLAAQQVTLSQTATIQSLSYYVQTTGGQLRLGIYNNSGSNTPGTLVAQTVAFTPVTGWNTQSVITQTILLPGTYWLAFLPQSNTLAGRVISSGAGRYYNYTFGEMPTTFSTTSTSSAFRFSLYATLSTGAIATNTATNTSVPNTITPTRTPTFTPTHTFTPNTPTFTNTPVPNTVTSTSTLTRTPTVTSTYTTIPNTATPTFTPSTTLTRTPTFTPTSTRTPTATATTSSTIRLGETTILSTAYSGMGNRLAAQQVTLSQSATIQSLSYYVQTTGGQLRLGIYNNSASNTPGTLVAQTAAFTPVAGWNTQPVITQTTLPAGTYWLAFLPQSNTLAGRVVGSGTGRYYTFTFGAMPSTYATTSTSSAFRFSLYATLSVP